MPSSISVIKDISSFDKSSRFISGNSNLKGSKNSDYLITSDFTGKLRLFHNKFLSSSVGSYKEKLKVTPSGFSISQ